MDSEVQENNVHDKFGEILNLLFGGSYRKHQTTTHFQDSILRAMNTVEILVELEINKQVMFPSSETELTSNSWVSYIKEQFSFPGVHVTNVQVTEMNTKCAIVTTRVVISTSTREHAIEIANGFYERVARKSYEKSFDKGMEKLLDKTSV